MLVSRNNGDFGEHGGTLLMKWRWLQGTCVRPPALPLSRCHRCVTSPEICSPFSSSWGLLLSSWGQEVKQGPKLNTATTRPLPFSPVLFFGESLFQTSLRMCNVESFRDSVSLQATTETSCPWLYIKKTQRMNPDYWLLSCCYCHMLCAYTATLTSSNVCLSSCPIRVCNIIQ